LNRQMVNTRFRFDPDLQFHRPELQALMALWQEKRAGRTVPDREDFTVFVLRPYLARVLIYEWQPQGRFRVRLYGTQISRYSGRDPTGKYLDEILSGEALEDFNNGLTWAMQHASPLRATGTYYFVDRSFVHFESITMPLTAGSDQITQLLTVTYFDDEE
jgi:hypothetical protein